MHIFGYISELQFLIFNVWNIFKMVAVAAIFRKFSEKSIFVVIILQPKPIIWNTWNFFFVNIRLVLRGEIPLEPLKKAVFVNFILGEWKRSKSGFFAYIRRHYLTSKKQFFHDRKIQNGGNMTDPVDSVAVNIFCGRQLPG